MPQTSKIAFALVIGFLVYITLRGELPVYAKILFGPAQKSAVGTSATSTASSAVNTPSVEV